MTPKELNIKIDATVTLVSWAKMRADMIQVHNAVNKYLESVGANRGDSETTIAHRMIAVKKLAIDCIPALSKKELSKVDKVLKAIAEVLP